MAMELTEQIRELIVIARESDKDAAFVQWADHWLSGENRSADAARRMNRMLRERIDSQEVDRLGSPDFFTNNAVAATNAVMLLHTDLPQEDKSSTIQALLNNTKLSLRDLQETFAD